MQPSRPVMPLSSVLEPLHARAIAESHARSRAFGLREHAGAWWWVGVALTGGAFVYEHAIVKPDDLSRVNRAFFTTNGFVGIALFVVGLADLLARGLGG